MAEQIPFISVIMPVYNRASTVGLAIESILCQSFEDFELIIIENGSNDYSLEVIQRYVSDKRIKLLINTKNRGSYWGTEQGIQVSQGEYVCFIGSDDIWTSSEKLKKQVNFFQKNHNEYGAIFFQPELIDSDGKKIKRVLFSSSTVQGDRYFWKKKFFYEMNFLCWSSVMVEKALLHPSSWVMGRFKQLCDKHHWLNVVQKKSIKILPDKGMVAYRLSETNESFADETAALNRSIFENSELMVLHYYNASLLELEIIFQKEVEELGTNFTESNKGMLLASFALKKTGSHIIDRSHSVFAYQVWFDALNNDKGIKEYQRCMQLNENQIVNFIPLDILFDFSAVDSTSIYPVSLSLKEKRLALANNGIRTCFYAFIFAVMKKIKKLFS